MRFSDAAWIDWVLINNNCMQPPSVVWCSVACIGHKSFVKKIGHQNKNKMKKAQRETERKRRMVASN
jgi:hypothetical protein